MLFNLILLFNLAIFMLTACAVAGRRTRGNLLLCLLALCSTLFSARQADGGRLTLVVLILDVAILALISRLNARARRGRVAAEEVRSVMKRKRSSSLSRALERFSHRVTVWSGHSLAFLIAFGAVLAWFACGPFFHFSTDYQMYINTGTTIVTFLMVFLIQRAQNKEMLAIHLKLNEIVAALEGASNRLIDVEDLTEEEVETLHRHYQRLVEMARRDADLRQSHSIEEAEARHLSHAGRPGR
ncbi:MAG TPA: low affinity iron permease family protein [Blastocatellia bacterium]|nr:low affinity iron permease family protein [Blastocatellia bacterium]